MFDSSKAIDVLAYNIDFSACDVLHDEYSSKLSMSSANISDLNNEKFELIKFSWVGKNQLLR